MEKNGMLILAQADHLTGEEIGFAMDQIMEWGAYNVYSFPGITKKNRTGCVLLIDIDPKVESKWSRLLAEQLSIFGYHQILTSHFCSRFSVQKRKLIIREKDACLETEIHVKTADDIGDSVRVEHADLARVREQVEQKLNRRIPLSKLRALLELQILSDTGDTIEIRL